MTQILDRAHLASLRHRLTTLARGIRHSAIPNDACLTEPQSKGSDTVVMEGKTLKRKRIVLLAPGCSVATCTMCPLPNEALDPKRCSITPEQIIAQFESAFVDDDINTYDVITIFNNGNFFVDAEMNPIVRQHIYTRMANSEASILVVETLPQFITTAKLNEAKTFLGTKHLAAAIGLQSSNDLIRELAINSTCTKPAFEGALRLLRDYSYIPIVFLMIKPPFLTEKEAIEDTVESVRYLSELGIQDPILCATRVSPNTVVDLLYQSGQFKPPWIWTVAEILKRISRIAPNSQPIIATSVLKPERNEDSTCTANCSKCTQRLIDALDHFDNTKDLAPLESVTCDCCALYQKTIDAEHEALSNTPIEERVRLFLEDQAAKHDS